MALKLRSVRTNRGPRDLIDPPRPKELVYLTSNTDHTVSIIQVHPILAVVMGMPLAALTWQASNKAQVSMLVRVPRVKIDESDEFVWLSTELLILNHRQRVGVGAFTKDGIQFEPDALASKVIRYRPEHILQECFRTDLAADIERVCLSQKLTPQEERLTRATQKRLIDGTSDGTCDFNTAEVRCGKTIERSLFDPDKPWLLRCQQHQRSN
jgi:hypothetical protein